MSLLKRWIVPAVCVLLTLRMVWYFMEPDFKLSAHVTRATKSPYYYFYNEMTGQVQWEDPGDVPYEMETGERFWVLSDGKRSTEDPHSWKYAW